MEKPTNLFFSASVEEKHTKQTPQSMIKKNKGGWRSIYSYE
jgi:hypothetical protein